MILPSFGVSSVVSAEVMIETLALRNIIRQNRIQEICGYMEMGMREKIYTLKQSIQILADAGIVSEETLFDAGENVIPGT